MAVVTTGIGNWKFAGDSANQTRMAPSYNVASDGLI